MSPDTNQKVTISLPPDLLRYADRYRQTHGLTTRSEVITKALKLLRERELAEGYQAMAQDKESLFDPWIDSALQETRHDIDRG